MELLSYVRKRQGSYAPSKRAFSFSFMGLCIAADTRAKAGRSRFLPGSRILARDGRSEKAVLSREAVKPYNLTGCAYLECRSLETAREIKCAENPASQVEAVKSSSA